MHSADPHVISLAGPVGLRNVAELAAELQRGLSASGPIVVDCAGLTEIDLSAVQLLLAAQRTARASGRAFALAAPPDGALGALLMTTGFLAEDGAPLTPDGGLWGAAERTAA